ncbi:hypothetical protein LTR84_012748 [Exophiala bonariae]|uniref:Fungal lipase-type domain-containing protein n=1 Tax=Exophiala bonariae TaxID=1690606 RepID=A0AAV9NFX8_9EURO|nr:hypothetical protein LTR84_012748 [Exophiala bonariae]
MDLIKIRLCAKAANFAYIASNPDRRAESNQLRESNHTKTLPDYLSSSPGLQGQTVVSFDEFTTRSHMHRFEDQHRYFKSYAYLLHLRKDRDVDTIVVGFRGTFNHSNSNGKNFIDDAASTTPSGQSFKSRCINWALDTLAPSNHGLSDFYYDATVIRVPYRQGSVWKWYSFWGMLMLEKTKWVWPRRVGADLVSKPSGESITARNDGHVHLGFWALWASPEGFAGFDDRANPPTTPSSTGLLGRCQQAITNAQKENRRTEILVVGHSLGGAVSCFAALDIATAIAGQSNVSLYHATFGAPPVGTAEFGRYFKRKLRSHQSIAVFHKKDVIPQVFAYCQSNWRLRWLGWWQDWSRVGDQRQMSKLSTRNGQPATGTRMTCMDKFKWAVVGTITVSSLLLANLGCVFGGIYMYLRSQTTYKDKENPTLNLTRPRREEDRLSKADVKEIGLEYHIMERYIELLEDSHPFDDLGVDEPAA